MHKSVVWLLALFAMGCEPEPEPAEEPPPEAADRTQDLFTQFNDEDPAELVTALEQLLPFMREKLGGVPDGADGMDVAWFAEIPRLEEDALGDLQMPEGVTSAEQKFPLARIRQSAFPVADQRALATEVNRICIESETTKWAEREFTSRHRLLRRRQLRRAHSAAAHEQKEPTHRDLVRSAHGTSRASDRGC